MKLSFPLLGKQYSACNDSTLFARVAIINQTDSVASFYEDWNMWGYFNIAFEIKTEKETDTIYKVSRDWPKNFLSFKVLFPGDSLVLSYNLSKSHCQASSFTGVISKPGNGLKEIRAIYQLDSALHANTQLRGDSIKYKYDDLPLLQKLSGRYRYKPLITDSLKQAVEAKRTFPLAKLESNAYRF